MKNLFRNLFLEPILVSHLNQKLSCIFVIFSSAFILSFLYIDTNSPKIFIDTPGYFKVNIKNPWSSGRTPGMQLYTKIIGVNFGSDSIKSKDNTAHVIDELKKIVRMNSLVYTIVIASLVYTLCKFLPPIYVLLITLGCCITNIPNPEHILADQLAFIFSVIFLIFCMEFYRNKFSILLFFICFSATCAFLVKPACCFLSIIATIICIFELLKLANKNRKKFFYTFFIFIFLIIGTLTWPSWLYIKGSIIVASQLSLTHTPIIMMHLTREGDEYLFKDNTDKKFIVRLLKEKKKYLKSNTEVTIENYTKMRNIYAKIYFTVSKEVYKKNFTYLERYQLNRKICSPIIKKYRYERIKHIFASVNNSFTVKVSPSAKFIYKKSSMLGKNLYNISFFLIFCGIITGCIYYNKDELYCISSKYITQIICICASIHLIHIFVSSIGHFVLTRYAEVTEWAFVLAVYLSLFNCIYFIIKITSSSLLNCKNKFKINCS